MTNLTPNAADEVEIRVGERDFSRDAYPVRLSLPDGSAATGWLARQSLPEPPGPDAPAADYGARLIELLLAGPPLTLFRRAWASARRGRRSLRVRLWLASEEAELHAIPWELLHLGEGADEPTSVSAGGVAVFSRYLDSDAPLASPVSRWPLRVAVAVSAPRDLGSGGRWPGLVAVDQAREERALGQVFRQLGADDRLQVTFLAHASPAEIERQIADGVDLFLYYGHGLYDPSLGSRLLLVDGPAVTDEGAARQSRRPPTYGGVAYPAEDLIQALSGSLQRPRLFLLISCNTGTQRANTPLTNMAARIVREGMVPAVLAMQDLVDVDLARSFTRHLLDNLLRYGVIDQAIAAARQAVRRRGDVSNGWATPVLYMRSRDGRLFEPDARMPFARLLSSDPQIRVRATALPARAPHDTLRARPEDAPLPREALAALADLSAAAPVRPVVIAGLSDDIRSLLLQQRRWSLQSAEQTVVIPIDLAAVAPNQGARAADELLLEAAGALDGEHELRIGELLEQPARLAGAARYVILVDGLGTLDPAEREAVGARLRELALGPARAQVAVSCASDLVPPSLQADTACLLLQPLSERQIRRYIGLRARTGLAMLGGRIRDGGLADAAADPLLLPYLVERLDASRTGLTRDQLMEELFERLMSRAARSQVAATVAEEGLCALAWELQRTRRHLIDEPDVFALLRRARGERDYPLETLYRALVEAGAIVALPCGKAQIVHPAIQAYAASRLLERHPDRPAILRDLMLAAADGELMAWWSDVLVGLAERADSPAELAPVWAALGDEANGAQCALGARCLGALRPRVRQLFPAQQLQVLLDTLILRLDPRFEHAAAQRAQLASALARLPSPQVLQALRRQIVGHMLLMDRQWYPDAPIVRMAAARALRDLALRITSPPSEDAPLLDLLAKWRSGNVDALRDLVGAPKIERERRLVAIFALADLAAPGAEGPGPAIKAALCGLTLAPRPHGVRAADWEAVQSAAVDALTQCDDGDLGELLAGAIQQPLAEEASARIAGLIAALGSGDERLLAWLLACLRDPGRPAAHPAAMRALARAGAALAATLPGEAESLGASLARIARDRLGREQTSLAMAAQPARQELSLRRAAVESLAWLPPAAQGDADVDISAWPIELREIWWETRG